MNTYYENNLQHLQDELKRIDLLIHFEIRRFREEREKSGKIPEEYRGLIITEEEIDGILKGGSDIWEKNNTEKSQNVDSEKQSKYLQELQTIISQKTSASIERGIYLSLSHLTYIFQLDRFEVDCILICLAPELDTKYERLYAYIQNDVTRKSPTVDLVLKLLCHTLEEKTMTRHFFSSHAQLFKHHIVGMSEDQKERHGPLISRSLKLDDRIVDFLLGYHQQIDARLKSIVTLRKPQAGLQDITISEEIMEKTSHIVSRLKGDNKKSGLSYPDKTIIYLKGPRDNGQQQTAEAICHELDLIMLNVNMEELSDAGMSFGLSLDLIFREALLQDLAVYFKGFDSLFEKSEKNNSKEILFLDGIKEFPGLIFLEAGDGSQPHDRINSTTFLTLEFHVPSYPVRKKLWETHINGHPVHKDADIESLANRFQFTGGQVREAFQIARNTSIMRKAGGPSITMEDLYEGCRAASNQKLASLATKIKPRYGWDDIVLPGDELSQLKDICNYVRFKHIVYGDWGFDKKLTLGKGLNALFHGPSGTGKTMASEVIAKDLGLDLYKIDLSTVVSKYIGETEKNLNLIFKEAETSNSILFFDEADAIFGKRSEVKDAHDRYANIEVGYLLQKMEEYQGIVILASNLMKNMDDSFVRRMHFQVELPFPDEEHRFRIWKTVFPREAPRDENIDFDFLAMKFKVAGGNIKNIILSSAFLAAENTGKIGMKHIIMSTKREFQKMGRLSIESDFGKYYNLTLDTD